MTQMFQAVMSRPPILKRGIMTPNRTALVRRDTDSEQGEKQDVQKRLYITGRQFCDGLGRLHPASLIILSTPA